jgi:hypothetical protein
MSEQNSPAEFLVICRGQWDSTLSRNEKQNVLDRFYTWVDELVDQGKMKPGQRLTHEGKTIGRKGAIIDGPFGEPKKRSAVTGPSLLTISRKQCRSPKAIPVWTMACLSKLGRSIRRLQLRTTRGSAANAENAGQRRL